MLFLRKLNVHSDSAPSKLLDAFPHTSCHWSHFRSGAICCA